MRDKQRNLRTRPQEAGKTIRDELGQMSASELDRVLPTRAEIQSAPYLRYLTRLKLEDREWQRRIDDAN